MARRSSGARITRPRPRRSLLRASRGSRASEPHGDLGHERGRVGQAPADGERRRELRAILRAGRRADRLRQQHGGPAGRNFDLYMIDVDGSDLAQITFDPISTRSPCSPPTDRSSCGRRTDAAPGRRHEHSSSRISRAALSRDAAWPVLCLLALPAPALSQDLPPLFGDRPDFTESASITSRGRIQFEGGWTAQGDDHVDAHALGALVRLGIAERWETWIEVILVLGRRRGRGGGVGPGTPTSVSRSYSATRTVPGSRPRPSSSPPRSRSATTRSESGAGSRRRGSSSAGSSTLPGRSPSTGWRAAPRRGRALRSGARGVPRPRSASASRPSRRSMR